MVAVSWNTSINVYTLPLPFYLYQTSVNNCSGSRSVAITVLEVVLVPNSCNHVGVNAALGWEWIFRLNHMPQTELCVEIAGVWVSVL